MEETVVKSYASIQNSLVTRSFLWMFGGLFATTVASFLILANPPVMIAIFSNPLLYWGLILAELGIVIYFSVRITRLSFEQALGLFFAYSILNGITLSVIFLAYTESSILTTFGVSTLTFGFMSFYGYTSKKDLTAIGNLCLMALVGIIIATIVNIFLQSTAFEMIISYLGILIFMGLTARDTQKLKALSSLANDSNAINKYAVMGALTLYLDFINLFLFILRLTGRRR